MGSNIRSNSMELDWRELDPYFNELQDCASFWTFVNLVGDAVYSALILLTVFLNLSEDSMFFEGMQSHVNPVLMYLILSLLVNFGAWTTNNSHYEKCFLLFSLIKVCLFPLTFGSFLYLIFVQDIQSYFGDFWVSFVVTLAVYNGISILAIWSLYICNKYIHVNEIAQKRQRHFLSNLKSYYELNDLCDLNDLNEFKGVQIKDKKYPKDLVDSKTWPVPLGIDMAKIDVDKSFATTLGSNEDSEEEFNSNPGFEDDEDNSNYRTMPSVWTVCSDGGGVEGRSSFCRHCTLNNYNDYNDNLYNLRKARSIDCIDFYSKSEFSTINESNNGNSDRNSDNYTNEFGDQIRRLFDGLGGSIDTISNLQITL